MTATAETVDQVQHRHGWWWKTLVVGALLWVLTAVVTASTQNANLIPTLILIGSFLIPLTVVLFAVERASGGLAPVRLMLAFIVGGVFGVLGASVFEANLQPSALQYLGVGAIEEAVKGVILIIVGWRVVPKNGYQGALLGATVGAGFAAFESAGYAFNAALGMGGINLVALLQTEVLRAALTPAGHVLWTAILGAALFSAAGATGRYRFAWRILLAYVAVVVLHALWDSMGLISGLLALLVSGESIDQIERGFVSQSVAMEIGVLAMMFYIIGLVVITIAGAVLLLVWGRDGRPPSRRRQRMAPVPVAG